jgi:hypothetical protein
MSAQSEGGGGGDTKENTRLVAAIVQAQAVNEGRKAVKISDIDRSVREGKGRKGKKKNQNVRKTWQKKKAKQTVFPPPDQNIY